jgi:hypothetical protein
MSDDRDLDYAKMQGMMDSREAVTIAGKGQPCERLVRDIRKQAVHAIEEGATPEEVIGMMRMETMRMEQKLLNAVINQSHSMKELIEEDIADEE